MSRPTTETVSFPTIPWTRSYSWQASEFGTFNPNTYNVWVSKRTYTGSVTANFGSYNRRKRSRLPPHDYTMTIVRCFGFPYQEITNYVYYVPYTSWQWSTYSFPNSAILLSVPGSAVHLSEAYTKARQRLASQVNGMAINLGQAFAERKQTAELIASSARRIVMAAVSLKHGRLGDFVNSLGIQSTGSIREAWKRVEKTPPHRRLANHWVEFQYGWKPLLQDTFGAADLLSRHISDDSWHHAIHSSGTADDKSYTSALNGANRTNALTVRTTKCRMAARYRMDSAARAVLGATGISNPALLAWELLPWSFVVDWFVPVGNYLESLDAFSGFSIIDGTVSNNSETKYQQDTSGTTTDYFSIYRRSVTTSWSAGYRICTYTRTTISSWPSAILPTFKNPLGGNPLERCTTALALLSQVFGR